MMRSRSCSAHSVSRIRERRQPWWLCMAVLLAAVSSAHAASGGIPIVQDHFTPSTPFAFDWQSLEFTEDVPNSVTGRAPALVNLPGGVWQWAPYNFYAQHIGTWTLSDSASYTVRLRGGGAAISLASSGSYVRPDRFRISADVSFRTTPLAGSFIRLGFWSGAQSSGQFTGISLDYQGGLTLVENGVVLSSTTMAFTGMFDPTVYRSLAFEIDTANGTISQVFIGGSTTTYVFNSTAFTPAATAYAGMMGGQANSSYFAWVDNFLVEDMDDADQAPVILQQPIDATATVGSGATFSVDAIGTPTPTYQWQRDGVAISGATSASYTTPSVTAADMYAVFTCVVTNAVASVTSEPAMLCVLAAGSPQVIISDDFTASAITSANWAWTNVLFTENDDPVVAGRAPNLVNLPGGTWQWARYFFYAQGINAWSTDPATHALRVTGDGGAAVSLLSSGSYVKPTTLRISAKVSFHDTTPSSTLKLRLGFWDVPQTQGHFTGLALDTAGGLTLVEGGVVQAGSTVAFTGTFDPTVYRTLTYDIDAWNGTISNVSLGGSTSTYAFTTSAFTAAATAYAGVNGSNGAGLQYGWVDDLQVTGLGTAAVVPAAGMGTGLTVAYYADLDLEQFVTGGLDPRLDHTWPAEPASGVPADGFSAAWQGFIEPRYSETYTISVAYDAGVRLWVDGQLRASAWGGGLLSRTWGTSVHTVTTTLPLTAGQRYAVRVDFGDTTGKASVKLRWSSQSQSTEVIPATQLYPLPGDRFKPVISTAATSRVSPACVEGAIGGLGVGLTAFRNGLPIGIQRTGATGWLLVEADEELPPGLVLDPTDAVELRVLGSDGVTSDSATRWFEWQVTDFADLPYGLDALTVRAGDSLLLAASGTGAATFTLRTLANVEVASWSVAEGDETPRQFEVPGAYTLTATRGGSTIATLPLTVISVDWDGPIACAIGYERQKQVAVLGADVTAVSFNGQNGDRTAVRTLSVDTTDDEVILGLRPILSGSNFMLARIGASGPVISRVAVDEFTIISTASQNAEIVELLPGDIWKFKIGMILSPWVQPVDIKAYGFSAGVTFMDGTSVHWTESDDLAALPDGTGATTDIFLLKPVGLNVSLCHAFQVFQNGVQVSP